MAIQFNIEQGGMLYAPSRDIRYGWTAAMRLVAARFDARAWPELAEWLDERGVSWDAQCSAMEALCRTLTESCQNPAESLEDLLRRHGWFDGPFEARAALMAMFGTVCLGQLFHALRSTSELGHRPVEFEPILHEEGDVMRRCAWRRFPWWKRWWYRIRRIIRGKRSRARTVSRSSQDWPPIET